MTSKTAEHFESADRIIATARAAWEEEKRELEQRILELTTHISLQESALTKACEARDKSLQTTARLLTQFGIVSQVFEDAKKLAIATGLYTKAAADKDIEVQTQHQELPFAETNAAVGREPDFYPSGDAHPLGA